MDETSYVLQMNEQMQNVSRTSHQGKAMASLMTTLS